MRIRLLAAGFGVALAAVALAACAPAASPSPSQSSTRVIAPVTMAANDLQGATVDLLVGQVLNVTTGDLAVDSYRGTVADAAVARFDAGHDDGSARFNPGVTALAPGTTAVTMTNQNAGIQPLEFTVVVTAG